MQKNGKLKALADMDDVYDKCREGLIKNIAFPIEFMDYIRSIPFLNVVAVGKASNDKLFAWIKGGKETLNING